MAPEGGGRTTAGEAMTAANQALSEIHTHEAVCAERYKNTIAAISELRGWLKWVGVTAVSAIIALGIWGFQQWITASQARASAQDAQFTALNRRMNDYLATRPAPPQVVVNSPPAQGRPSPEPYATAEPATAP